ncbi:MAG TPA: metal-dependent hydrolase [Thermodesulfobacteriota bacterium]|nr:metal-dependent hydrolase [Thermodesulfobacteriota bacterium]
MDTITHGLIGVLASKSGFYQKARKAATIAFLVGAVFPDADVITAFFGPEFSLRYHRGITHSVIAAPFFALILGAIIYRFSSFKNFRFLTLMVALGTYSHIFFDLITSYGTVIFDPLSMERYSWNLVFILDPFITIPVLIGLIICWKKEKLALRVSAALFVFLSFYLLFCLYSREAVEERLVNFTEERSLNVIKSSVYPSPLAPIFWMGVIETDDKFYKVNMRLFGDDTRDVVEITKTDENRFVNMAKDLRTVQLYLWFAEFPVSRYRIEDSRYIVEFYDLRFGMLPNRKPFLLRVTFDKNGSLKDIYLNGRFVEEKLS